MAMARIIIVGAGISGLNAGYQASLRGLDYVICEQESEVGGLCKTIEREGFSFDYSGHLLYLKSPYFKSLVRNLLRNNLNIHHRRSYIYSHGVFTPYPFQANLRNLPPKVIQECLLEFVKAYYENEDLPTSRYETFADWVEAKLGKGIGKYFMMPYNTKIWTVSPKELTCEWLSEYVPRPSLDEVFDGAFSEQRKEFGYNLRFWYPKKGGIQALCNSLAERIPNIQLKEKLVCIHLSDRIAEFASGNRIDYEFLISTIPLKTLVEKVIADAPDEMRKLSRKLRHNSILILNLGIKGRTLADKHWIYLPEKKYTPYRIGIYSNFSEQVAPPDTTSYYIEIAYQKKWNIDRQAAIRKALANMQEMGLIRGQKDILVQNVLDVETAYVIYDRHYARTRATLLKFLEKHHIHCIGRYGRWEYSGMEEGMRQARDTIEHLAQS
jgi:protoporphyrinogen oxidase